MGKKKNYRKRQPCPTTWLLTAYSTFLDALQNNSMRLPRCDSPTPLTVRCRAGAWKQPHWIIRKATDSYRSLFSRIAFEYSKRTALALPFLGFVSP